VLPPHHPHSTLSLHCLHYFLSPPSPPPLFSLSQLLLPVCSPPLLWRSPSPVSPHLLHLPHSATAQADLPHQEEKRKGERRRQTRWDSNATCLLFSRGTQRDVSPPLTSTRYLLFRRFSCPRGKCSCIESGSFSGCWDLRGRQTPICGVWQCGSWVSVVSVGHWGDSSVRFREIRPYQGLDLRSGHLQASVRRPPTEPRSPPFIQTPSTATAHRFRSRRPFTGSSASHAILLVVVVPSLDSGVLEVHADKRNSFVGMDAIMRFVAEFFCGLACCQYRFSFPIFLQGSTKPPADRPFSVQFAYPTDFFFLFIFELDAEWHAGRYLGKQIIMLASVSASSLLKL
jgi:hypothetical protein